MERNSYATYSVGKGKEYSFEFKQEAVFAAQELGVKPAARKFKIAVNTMRSWLKKFKDDGKKFNKGIVLYAGDRILPLGDDLQAVPISALWT